MLNGALKVELDVPGELRAKHAPLPLATPARRDATLHLKARSSGSLEMLLSVAGTPHVARPSPSAIGPRLPRSVRKMKAHWD